MFYKASKVKKTDQQQNKNNLGNNSNVRVKLKKIYCLVNKQVQRSSSKNTKITSSSLMNKIKQEEYEWNVVVNGFRDY